MVSRLAASEPTAALPWGSGDNVTAAPKFFRQCCIRDLVVDFDRVEHLLGDLCRRRVVHVRRHKVIRPRREQKRVVVRHSNRTQRTGYGASASAPGCSPNIISYVDFSHSTSGRGSGASGQSSGLPSNPLNGSIASSSAADSRCTAPSESPKAMYAAVGETATELTNDGASS